MSSELIERKLRADLDAAAEQHMPVMVVQTAYLSGVLATIAALQAELAEARNECLEQARLLGMSAERELDLQARLTEAREVPGRIAAWLVSLDGPNLDADAGNAGLQFGVLMQAQEAIEARDWSK